MVNNERLKQATNKRKASDSGNTNVNASILGSKKPKQNSATKQQSPLESKQTKSQVGKFSQRRGNLQPRRIILDGKIESLNVQQKEQNKPEQQNLIPPQATSSPDLVHSGHSSSKDNRKDNLVNKQNMLSQGSHAIIPHDGIILTVPESEDIFATSETEDLDSELEDQLDVVQAPSSNEHNVNNEDEGDGISPPETSLSVKKSFLRKELERDPTLKEVFFDMVNEEVSAREKSKGRCSVKENRGNISKEKVVLNQHKSGAAGNKLPVVKSPSESTIYTSAFKKVEQITEANNVIDKITNFAESICMDSRKRSSGRKSQTPTREEGSRYSMPRRPREEITPHQITPQPGTSKGQDPDQDIWPALDKADRIILDAERLRANLVAPQGMVSIKIDQNIQLLRNLDNDDDFFHVSCHIDSVMKTRIQKGEFIDLEKLLPKEKGGYQSEEAASGLEIVTRNGHAYLAPPASERRINGIQRWDQAFHVYATILLKPTLKGLQKFGSMFTSYTLQLQPTAGIM